jgi:hypothetical protein
MSIELFIRNSFVWIFRADEKRSVADKRNLFETISKDAPIGGTLPRSKSFKNEDSPSTTKKYANGNQRSQTENIVKSDEKESYDDDTSKLSFKEKMTLFNKNKSIGLAPTSSFKNNRNRLTQVIARRHFLIENSFLHLANYCRRSSSSS